MDVLTDDVAPQALLLPNQDLLFVFMFEKTCRIRDASTGSSVELTGSFLTSIQALLQGNIGNKLERLVFLEKQHAWLRGLSQAKPIMHDMRYTIIGQSLGMFFVELTSQCNEKCVHCYADSAPERTDFLSLNEVKQVLNQARLLGKPYVQFTGGDPLIHQNLIEILAYAHALEFVALEVYTNGLLLNDSLLSKMKPYQPKIAFSLYSHLAETHDLITRVKGSHKRTCDAIQRAKNAGFSVRVSVILMQQNVGQGEKTAYFLQDELGLSAEMIKFYLSRDIGRGSAFELNDVSSTSESNQDEYDKATEPKLVGKAKSHVRNVRKGKLCVSATGEVFPCVFSRNQSMGNIKHLSLEDILAQATDNQPVVGDPVQRWKSCQEQLSCGDCQLVTYAIGG